MKHFLLFYDYVPDYLERRTAHRPAHFAHARAAVERGELFLAGAANGRSRKAVATGQHILYIRGGSRPQPHQHLVADRHGIDESRMA